ncbi:hypothetical protein NLJ89_g8360 [Agrocybe chaxingu]|uniref:DUF6533 domain-containing protein n=1 Tax=Agrocybe chaxingu TaxID=84603 RepID=A0A9W8K2L3_9AGAR|nr:hypothetical protein NLJ89_g8360 [Agrocybe chaxingu]
MSTLDLSTLSLTVQRARLESRVNGASTAIIVYDWFLTIHLEVATIWSSKWTLTKVLYMISRYTTFLEVALLYCLCSNVLEFSDQLTSGPPAKVCQTRYQVHASYTALKQGGNHAMLKVVYRDGIVYYSYLFVLSLVNVIVMPRIPSDLATLLALLVRTLHALLTCRVILHIRAQGQAAETVLVGDTPAAFRGMDAWNGGGVTSEEEIRFRTTTQVSTGPLT